MPKRIFPTILAISVVMQATRAFACAVCLSGADDKITHGYNASVLFLMATPYVVGACIAVGLIFAYRRACGREQSGEDSPAQLEFKREESSQ
jgi:hypothetical protein